MNATTDTGWHFSDEDRQSKGPVAFAKLSAAVSSGRIKPADLVWHESIGDWQRIDSVPILASAIRVVPAPPPIQRQVPPPVVNAEPSRKPASNNSSSRTTLIQKVTQDRAVSIVSFAFFAAVALIPVAILASQYFPFTGGVLTGIAEPWSPARRSGIPSHVLVLSLVGLFLGGVTGELLHRSKAAAMACVVGIVSLFSVSFLMCLLLVR